MTPRFQSDYVATAAHELAHQWFGNLVTMAWWDDLWLNESFASWLGDRITHERQPGWGYDSAAVTARREAMRTDRLQSSRRIPEPVRSEPTEPTEPTGSGLAFLIRIPFSSGNQSADVRNR